MRVAVLDPSLFSLPYDRHLCRALAEAGNEVCLYGRPLRPGEEVPKHQPTNQGFKRAAFHFRRTEAAPIRGLPERFRLFAKGAEHFLDWSRLLRHLRQQDPEIIHVQWLAFPLIDRWFLRRLRAIAPLVITVHDAHPFHGSPAHSLQSKGWFEALGLADLLLAHTQHTEDVLNQKLQPSPRIARVAHGPLWPEGHQPQGSSRNTETEEARLRLLLFGAIKPYKGLDLLLHALADLNPEQRTKVKVTVAGPLRMKLSPVTQELCEKLGGCLDLRPDFVPEVEIGELLSQNDLMVLPYRESDASGVFALAVAQGMPVLASRVGGLEEALMEGGGLLLSATEPRAWTQAISRLLTETDHLAALQNEMRTLQGRWPSWASIAAETQNHYRSARDHWTVETAAEKEAKEDVANA